MEQFARTNPLHDDADARLPAAAYLTYQNRADGWSAGRQAAFLAHLADNGVAADAARCVGMSVQGGYALRRTARGYAFNLGWEAALIIARRIVADNLMTAAIRGEQSRWVREDGVTTYTRQNTKLSLTLLDRVNPAAALPEVIAVATDFDAFLAMIDAGLGAAELWDCFFDGALPHDENKARARVRAALQLSEESADFDDSAAENSVAPNGATDDGGEPPMEYKSMDAARRRGPPRPPRCGVPAPVRASVHMVAAPGIATLFSGLVAAQCDKGDEEQNPHQRDKQIGGDQSWFHGINSGCG